MTPQLDKLIHSLANRMQAAAAAAGLLELSGALRDDAATAALQKLMDELYEASRVVQAMATEYERGQSQKKSATR